MSESIVDRLRGAVARVGKPMPMCKVCQMSKPPVGRSVPLEAGNGHCSTECPGYDQPPYPDSLWPNEPTMHEFVSADLIREAADLIEKGRYDQ